jgi:hypothetical protein
MLGQLPFNLDAVPWELAAAPLAGLLFCGLMLYLGRSWLRAHHLGPPRPKDMPPQPDPFVYGSATEKRTSLRRSGKAIKVLISDAEAVATPVEGWVMDRSMGGLGLTVRKEIKEETILSVRSVDAPSNTPWVQVEVKRSIPKDGGWELGCQYVRTPSWSVLLLFG